MTNFAAGYSFAAAALFSLGISVAFATKILAAIPTLLGWLGWARLARSYFSIDAGRSRVAWWTALTIATVTPLLFTPWWSGTDIFL